ncbi:hypothetical protein [Morganella morganii]|uniref:hypothetical protein n=1 Tax=Morganella morganii TaxID=582 RepID=UPI000D83E73C|nr:hypothetical protein [Morganella morganii]SPX92021.1 Uncharacterised protein [Morganella morganii]SPX92420.1 Uncharacterised protein [Morganella morganii]
MQQHIAITYVNSCHSQVTLQREHEIHFDETSKLRISTGSAEAVIALAEGYRDVITEDTVKRMDAADIVDMLRKAGFDMDVIAQLAGRSAA